MASLNKRSSSKWRVATVLVTVLIFSLNNGAASDVERHRLKNGLSVLLSSSKVTDQIALVVLYSVGDDHDPLGRCGLAHLTEHLYVTAAAGDTPARTVQEYVRRYPKGWNAQTGTDYTLFAAVFPKDQLEAELRDAAARMNDLRPTEADLDRERPRLLQELRNMFGGFAPLASINHARALVRPSRFGHRRGGLAKHVQQTTVDDVRQWLSKHYKPINATIVVAGAVAPDAARKLIEKYFASIPPGEKPPAVGEHGPPNFGPTKIVGIEPVAPDARAHASIAFAAPQPGDMHYVECLVLVNRMWRRAASSSGQQRVTFSLLDDPTLIAISSQVGPEQTPDQAVASLRSFLDQAVTGPLQPVDRRVTKNSLGLFLGLGDFPDAMWQHNLYGVALSIGRCEQLGVDSAAIARKLGGLTDKDVKAAAAVVFGERKQVAVVVTPKS